ncbi:hypothetical protein N7499_007385 [Penicillium canescens]|uniref:Uncharacterized protein n=1 Tax=Penicillium canescens TaxID=5083 RepID=A0AAD6IFA6_PENCN|nr:uncharacterized protein N7446_003075 [Penicillium canescens]KAJ6044881.1 hypothetical protein N7460_006236 [Penicillium canescens]KAJ6056350.1 hypothetical protein N7444_005448 [Penicillium canescens]KAJ6075298.1 hypothetical protein N7446_003075 [Penicillium canescens]KAJ6082511.1 hypothetical protein N7499_007385 [Penicillium canescens]KAJ6175693.1 hypothetical protein N7485_002607 [Penicillium canescens]
MSSTSSPGNGIFPNGPTMRQPSMSWLYRLECSTEDIELGAPHNGDTIRSIANIVRGSVKGPGIEGEILPLGGADWATVVKGTHSMTLDARYTVRTSDRHYLYIRAHGLYRPGPESNYAKSVVEDPNFVPPATVSQDDVEFFSHLRIEAGPGPYNWLNGLVCLGVMCCEDEKIWIDAYYLTNFPGVKPENVVAR